ncbi:MAG: VIT1/CCC1 transporter family protein, partial [Candidatus Yanofskybacteria bacterium]|nr:VIT1/CCC1 transporter family protein [Candidatus Yanofskybacteria bacterium]
MSNLSSISYFRNFVFGVEDSLVSTVGLLSGIAIAEVPRSTIFLTGFILIFVEAFSMAAGSFLSEYSAEGYAVGAETPSRKDFISGIIMFFSYFVSGFIPLFPYFVWSTRGAFAISVILSVLALFILGIVGAKVSKTNMAKNGLRMAVVGGVAIVVGIIGGSIIP